MCGTLASCFFKVWGRLKWVVRSLAMAIGGGKLRWDWHSSRYAYGVWSHYPAPKCYMLQDRSLKLRNTWTDSINLLLKPFRFTLLSAFFFFWNELTFLYSCMRSFFFFPIYSYFLPVILCISCWEYKDCSSSFLFPFFFFWISSSRFNRSLDCMGIVSVRGQFFFLFCFFFIIF